MKRIALGPPAPPRFGLERQAKLAGLALLVGLMVATALAYFFQVRLLDATRLLSQRDVPQNMRACQAALRAARCLMLQSEFEAAEPSGLRSRKETIESWIDADHAMTAILREGATNGGDAADRAPFARWLKLADRHRQEFLALARAVEAGQLASPRSLRDALSKCRFPLDTIMTEAERHAELQAAACRTDGRRLQELVESNTGLITLRAVIALLAFAGMSCWLVFRVLRRIGLLSAAVQRFKGGARNTRIVSGADDELGILARQFNEMASMIQHGQERRAQVRDRAESSAAAGSTASKETPIARTPVEPAQHVGAVRHPEESASPWQHANSPGDPGERPKCRVLVAEDGPENQRLISFVLKKAGGDVVVVDNGEKATEAVLSSHGSQEKENPFDLVLMDIEMPVMDGCQATQRLRQAGYSGLVIAVTAHASRYDRDRCLEAGFDDYIAKPIDRNRLLNMLARHAIRLAPSAEAAILSGRE